MGELPKPVMDKLHENDFEFLIAAMPMRMAVADRDLRIALANPSMLKLYGVTLEEFKGTKVADLWARNGDKEAAAAWEKARCGERVQFLSKVELSVPARTLVHQVTLIPRMVDGALDHIVCVAQDISDLYQANCEISALNEDLEQRAKQRTEELAQTLENLNNARNELVKSEAKTTLGAMVGSITHEMSAPIGNSLMTAGTLHDQVEALRKTIASGQLRRSDLDRTLESLTTGVEIVTRNLARANDLLKSIKQGAADQFSEQRREFDLKETFEEILTLVRPTLKKAPHQIKVDVPAGIVIDSYPGPIGQVLINLINNAWLHAFEGMASGVLEISAAPCADKPGEVCIVIADNGAGMSEEVQARLFEPFFSTKIGKGGTGLGMSIVEDIVTKTLGGNLELESSPGKGTRFVITLPLDAPKAE
jgi:PAS domain S-box-containing protein